jgi:predicted anti-sigma-YlaC factor YlaD
MDGVVTHTAGVRKTVRRGPPITLTCDCGERRYLRYGERWTCEKCGKTWNTNRIPVEQYAAIRATQLRYRRVPLAISVFALVCVVAFIIVGKALGGLIVVGLLASTWSMFFRPIHRRKYREAIADLPSWKIKPE